MELRRRPGTQRDVRVATTLPGLQITGAQVPDDAELVVDAILESIEGGGHGERHGAGAVDGGVPAVPRRGRRAAVTVDLSEVFEVHPVEGETYPIEGDEVDLEPVVRDAALLNLPLAPLCRPDCAGPAPDVLPDASVEDDEPEAEEPAARPPLGRPRRPRLRRTEPPALEPRSTVRGPPLVFPGCAAGQGSRSRAPARPVLEVRITDGRPQEEDLQGEEPQPPGQRLEARGPPGSVCPRCGATKLPHVVCGNCGWYGGRQAIDVECRPSSLVDGRRCSPSRSMRWGGTRRLTRSSRGRTEPWPSSAFRSRWWASPRCSSRWPATSR